MTEVSYTTSVGEKPEPTPMEQAATNIEDAIKCVVEREIENLNEDTQVYARELYGDPNHCGVIDRLDAHGQSISELKEQIEPDPLDFNYPVFACMLSVAAIGLSLIAFFN